MTAPTKLLYAEEILSIVLKAVKDTPLWEGATVQHSGDLGPGTKAYDIVLKTDARKRKMSALLEKYWARAACKTETFFSIRTYNRLAYAQAVAAIASALNGLQLELEEDTGWTWDHDDLQPDGCATYRTAFELRIYMGGPVKFDAVKWMKTALAHVCASADVRADESPFQLEKRIRGKKDCIGSAMTRKGFILDYPTLRKAQEATSAVYGGCKVTFLKKDHYHEATVVFP